MSPSLRCTSHEVTVGVTDDAGALAKEEGHFAVPYSEEIDSEKFTRIAFKCARRFFGHQNGGRIYLNGVSHS